MRPMLASTPTQVIIEKHLSETLLLASTKLDGIRAITTKTGLRSRSLKLIRNKYIQETLKDLPSGLDGELIVGGVTEPNVFAATSSGVMSVSGKPNFIYHIFDVWNSEALYIDRWKSLVNLLANYQRCLILEQQPIMTFEELKVFEHLVLNCGYEGVIIRRPDAPYKFNRATNREGYLMKIKQFKDSEAIIIGVNQKYHNSNEATTNELGLTSRSSDKENKIPVAAVGSFKVKDIKNSWVFEVHGFSHANAAMWWSQREDLLGKIITYKYLAIGMKDVPRHPIFKGFRDPIDF